MIDPTQTQFFLGTNTPEGFHSLYSHLLPPHQAKATYILKGGIASGSNQLLQQLSAEAQGRGVPFHQILNVSNPNVLDGLLLPSLQTAIIQGTPPHVVEPTYPGLIEHYVNLGEAYQSQALQEKREDIIALTKAYKESNAQILPCLSTAGELGETISNILSTQKLTERLNKRANGIINREIKGKSTKSTGKITQRFLSANTSQGKIALFHSATQSCDKIYQLWDSYGIAHGFLLPLLTGAINRGYDVTACLHPMNPQRLEHIIIPQLSLCFLSASPSLPLQMECYRRIRLETMLDSGLLKQNRSRLRVYRKMYHSLTEEITHVLADSQRIHNKLETIYAPFVDENKVSQITARLGEQVFHDHQRHPKNSHSGNL